MHDFVSLIFYVFRRAIPPALICLTFGVVLLVLVNRKFRREGMPFPKGQAAAILLLLCYLGGLAAVTFMNRMESGMGMGIQLRPFLAFREAWNAFTLQVWLNPLLNIAMFLPLGVLLPLAVKRFQRWYWMLAAGAGTSLVIEGLQHFLSRGQADVDDLICNTLGAMLGYCLVMLFLSLKGKRWKCAGAYAVLPVIHCGIGGRVSRLPLPALWKFSGRTDLCCQYQGSGVGAGVCAVRRAGAIGSILGRALY